MPMNSFVTQKSQELSFALLRVAGHIRRFELRRTIERLSYHLLENISYENPEMSLSTIAALRNFVTLGKNVYEIETVNARILDRELEHLAAEVRKHAGVDSLPDLETLFTQRVEIRQNTAKGNTAKTRKLPHSSPLPVSAPTEVVIPESEIQKDETQHPDIEDGNTAIRRDKLFLMLSTAPEKRLALKEIVAAFPDVSERTLRYDLKRLADDGRIVRQGTGGPSNYYMVNSSSFQGVINSNATSL